VSDLLPEQLSEKTTTEIKIFSGDRIPSFEYFVQVKSFEKLVLGVMFGSFLIMVGSLVV